jgi:hypothetical protein
MVPRAPCENLEDKVWDIVWKYERVKMREACMSGVLKDLPYRIPLCTSVFRKSNREYGDY